MKTSPHKNKPFPLALAQMPITGDAKKNGTLIQTLMREAAQKGARLILFPEGALTGYAKNPIQNWGEVNWKSVREELQTIMRLAKDLNLWVVLGAAHPLTPPHWPHNSLYIISDQGSLLTRYDKRICSHTETTQFYSPGTEPITFEVDGFTFGCLICIEINFPTLFLEYNHLEIDCLLLSAYPVDKIFFTKAQAHAAIHTLWIGLSVPTECATLMKSGVIGPDGFPLSPVPTAQGVMVTLLDINAPEYEVALQKARPWRKRVSSERIRKAPHITDPRSEKRTSY